MKQIRLFSMMLLLATMFLGFTACSSDDDNNGKEEHLIVGKWKELGIKTSTILEFNLNGTFQYTDSEDTDYEEHGKWKIESDGKLYFLFSDEDTWWASKIHEVNSTSLVMEEYLEDNTTLSGSKDSYQRIK